MTITYSKVAYLTVIDPFEERDQMSLRAFSIQVPQPESWLTAGALQQFEASLPSYLDACDYVLRWAIVAVEPTCLVVEGAYCQT